MQQVQIDSDVHRNGGARCGGAVAKVALISVMAEVRIYTTAFCPYCSRAKRLLTSKGVAFEEIDVTFDPTLRERMVAEAGRYTVPQIFIDGVPVGGSDELQDLEDRGELDALLGRVLMP